MFQSVSAVAGNDDRQRRTRANILFYRERSLRSDELLTAFLEVEQNCADPCRDCDTLNS